MLDRIEVFVFHHSLKNTLTLLSNKTSARQIPSDHV